MLGLRPRLKHRPSLLDLIQRHNLEAGPALPTLHQQVDDELPTQIPLPESPTLTRTRPARSSSTPPATPKKKTLEQTPVVRVLPPPPPKPVLIKEAKMAPAKTEKNENTGTVFSISGPVIVAEDMVGAAMYELVCLVLHALNHNILMAIGLCRP